MIVKGIELMQMIAEGKIKDGTDKIEELNTKGIYDYGELLEMYEYKINELVRAINKLNKQDTSKT